jgi:hypothetical protein
MSTAQKYTSAPLSGLAGGRLMKLLGDMFLLAGMYADAIKCFDDGAERCRAVGDVLWEGLAREGRAVAGIGEAWEGRDGSVSQTSVNVPKRTARLTPRTRQYHFLQHQYRSRYKITFYPLSLAYPAHHYLTHRRSCPPRLKRSLVPSPSPVPPLAGRQTSVQAKACLPTSTSI